MPSLVPSIKALLPRSFFGRAVLIVVVPILLLQIILSVVFVQRHYERVTQQLTGGALDAVTLIIERIEAAPLAVQDQLLQSDLAQALEIDLAFVDPLAAVPHNGAAWYDLAGQEVLSALSAGVPGFLGAALRDDPDRALFWVQTRHGPLQVSIPRSRLAPTNPHQLLVLVFVASLVLVLIALQYLRLQIRPIRRLGAAAEAYGRGQSVQLRASGAREIRAAALAFIDMRNRLERQNAQRKMMLSGLGHDMRTPLTRMRLMISMADPSEDRDALETEIADLETLINGFLDYARGEEAAPLAMLDPACIVEDLVARYHSVGQRVDMVVGPNVPDAMLLREGQLDRAIGNILGNALEYGSAAYVQVFSEGGMLKITVEDDGPGIAPEDRARVCEPFVRLDQSRNQNKGAHVGLGLAIAQDIARRHGGKLTLEDSAKLGGLRVVLQFPIEHPDAREVD